jgi:hypothetical protein
MMVFFKGDRVRHALYGVGTILSLGYRQASVRFGNGLELDVTTDNLKLLPY